MSRIPHSPSPLKSGDEIGAYTIRRLIGRGRETEVYRAYDQRHHVDVALKRHYVGAAQSGALEQCFRKEVATLASLSHSNIVAIKDYGIDGDVFYLVLSLVEGGTLRDVIAENPTGIESEECLRIFKEIAGAVSYAHRNNVVHRNIKPNNVLINSQSKALLTDFVIPCIAETRIPSSQYVSGRVPTYLAPEQATQAAFTPQVDIYTLGVLLYEMVTGDVPFKGANAARVIAQHVSADPTPPSQLCPSLDPRIERAILKMLSKNPADRFATTDEIIKDLERDTARSEYATLAFHRNEADEVRKHQSEIIRFNKSRIAEESPTPFTPPAVPESLDPDSEAQSRSGVFFVVAAVTIFLLVAIATLLI